MEMRKIEFLIAFKNYNDDWIAERFPKRRIFSFLIWTHSVLEKIESTSKKMFFEATDRTNENAFGMVWAREIFVEIIHSKGGNCVHDDDLMVSSREPWLLCDIRPGNVTLSDVSRLRTLRTVHRQFKKSIRFFSCSITDKAVWSFILLTQVGWFCSSAIFYEYSLLINTHAYPQIHNSELYAHAKLQIILQNRDAKYSRLDDIIIINWPMEKTAIATIASKPTERPDHWTLAIERIVPILCHLRKRAWNNLLYLVSLKNIIKIQILRLRWKKF